MKQKKAGANRKTAFAIMSIAIALVASFVATRRLYCCRNRVQLSQRISAYVAGVQGTDTVMEGMAEEYTRDKAFNSKFYQEMASFLFHNYGKIYKHLFDVLTTRSEEEHLIVYVGQGKVQLSNAYMTFKNKEAFKSGRLYECVRMIKELAPSIPQQKIEIFISQVADGHVHEPAPVFSPLFRMEARTRIPFPPLWCPEGDSARWIEKVHATMQVSCNHEWRRRKNRLLIFEYTGIADLDMSFYVKQRVMAMLRKSRLAKIVSVGDKKKFDEDDMDGAMAHRVSSFKYLLLGGANKHWIGLYARRMLYSGSVLLLSRDTDADHDVSVLGMKPFVHYVPVSKNYKNVLLMVWWLEKNPKIAQQIAENGFYYFYFFNTQNSYKSYAKHILDEYVRRTAYTPQPLKDVFSV